MQQKVQFPPVTEESVSWGKGSKLAQGFKAIVNPSTGHAYSVVSDKYKLIQHEEAAQKVTVAIQDKPELGPFKITTQFYGEDKARMRRAYRFENIGVEIAVDDVVHLELLLFNSYDCTWPFSLILGAFRLICSNGLTVGKEFFRLRQKHIVDLDQFDLKKDVTNALSQFNKQSELWKRWTDRPLTPQIYNGVMGTMDFGLEATDSIHRRVYDDTSELDQDYFPIMSIWIFYNVLTWYITHRTVSLNHRIELERRLRKAMRYLD